MRLRPKYMFFVYFFLCFDIVLSDFCYTDHFKSYRAFSWQTWLKKAKKGLFQGQFKVISCCEGNGELTKPVALDNVAIDQL